MMKSVILSEQPVILEKPAIWSRVFLWMIMLITSSALIWAYFARVEQAVPATGQLELKEGSREIQAPTTGTVVRLHVEDGDRVEKDQPLLTFSPTAPSADLESVKNVKAALERENKFYEDVVNGRIQGPIPSNLESVIKDRQSLISQNQVLQVLIDEVYLNRPTAATFDPIQQGLYVNYRSEYQSRVAAAQGQVSEYEKQLQQAADAERAAREQLRIAESQLGYAQNQLNYSQQQLNSTREQLKLAQDQLTKSQEVLSSNKNILDRLSPLVEEGAIAELQKDRQQQEVLRGQSEVLKQQDQIKAREGEINTRQGEINTRYGEINSRRGELQKIQAEIERQIGEQSRLQESVNRAVQQLQNTKDTWAKELYTRIAENQKAIASSDSQLSRLKLDNQKKLSELNAQLEKTQQTRDTQVMKAPVSGVIFDLKPSKKEKSELNIQSDPICQYVINAVQKPGEPRPQRCEDAYYEAQQTEKLLKILDDDEGLEAVVYLKNEHVALILDALQRKRAKLQAYHGKQLDGEKIDCEKDKSCVCPEKEVNRQKLGLTHYDCVPVEVMVEAYPAMEFGTLEGEVKSISKDAIAPTELRQYFSFKTTLKLKSQNFILNKGKENQMEVGLQSGMAVSTNINIGKRTVLQMFLNKFTGKLETFKTYK